MVRVIGQEPDVADRFDPNAAEADQQYRAPGRIALRADHQLETAPAHLLDQTAVENDTRRPRSDVAHHRLPRLAQRRVVGDVQRHAAGLGLVRERGSLRL